MKGKLSKHTHKANNLQLCVQNSYKHIANRHASSIFDVTRWHPARASTYRLLLSLYHTVSSRMLWDEIKNKLISQWQFIKLLESVPILSGNLYWKLLNWLIKWPAPNQFNFLSHNYHVNLINKERWNSIFLHKIKRDSKIVIALLNSAWKIMAKIFCMGQNHVYH